MRQRLPIDFLVSPVASRSQDSFTVPIGSTPDGWDLRNPSMAGAVFIEPQSQGARLAIPDLAENGRSLPEVRGVVSAIPTILKFGAVFSRRGSVRVWLAATNDFQNGVFLHVQREATVPLVERLPPYGFLREVNEFNRRNLYEQDARGAFGLQIEGFPRSGFNSSDDTVDDLRVTYTFGYVIEGEVTIAQVYNSLYSNQANPRSVNVEFGLNPFNIRPGLSEPIVYALIRRTDESLFSNNYTNVPPPNDTNSPENQETERGAIGSTQGFIDFSEPFNDLAHVTISIPAEAVATEEHPLAERTTIIEILPTTSGGLPSALPRLTSPITIAHAITGEFTPHAPSGITGPAGLTPVCLTPRASYAIGGFQNFVPDIADASPYATKDGPSWSAHSLAPHGTFAARNGALSSLTVQFPEWYIPFLVLSSNTREYAGVSGLGFQNSSGATGINNDPRLFEFINVSGIRVGNGFPSQNIATAVGTRSSRDSSALFRNALSGQSLLMQPFIKGQRLLPGQFAGFHFLEGRTITANVSDSMTRTVSYSAVAESFATAYRRFPLATVDLSQEESWSEFDKVEGLGVSLDSFDYWTRRPARYVEPADVRIVLDVRVQFLVTASGTGFPGGGSVAREVYRRIGIRIASDNVVNLANGIPVQAEMVCSGYGSLSNNPNLCSDPTVPFPFDDFLVGFSRPYDNFELGFGIYPLTVTLVTA